MLPHLGALVRQCRGIAVRWWPTVRVGLASYWTAGTAWVVTTALHGRWLLRSQHAGEVVSGYGAGLIMLGLFVASRPYLRDGIRSTAEQAVRGSLPQPTVLSGPGLEAYAAHEERVAAAIPDVRAERVIAVAVVMLGTFLNGYGTPLARRWGLPI